MVLNTVSLRTTIFNQAYLATNDIRKEYSNGELTVIWKPGKCIHYGICVKTLPEVYHPKEKPWILPENASTDGLKDQI